MYKSSRNVISGTDKHPCSSYKYFDHSLHSGTACAHVALQFVNQFIWACYSSLVRCGSFLFYQFTTRLWPIMLISLFFYARGSAHYSSIPIYYVYSTWFSIMPMKISSYEHAELHWITTEQCFSQCSYFKEGGPSC